MDDLPSNVSDFTKFMIKHSASDNYIHNYYMERCRTKGDSSEVSKWIIRHWNYLCLIGDIKCSYNIDDPQVISITFPRPFGEYKVDKGFPGDDTVWNHVNNYFNLGLKL